MGIEDFKRWHWIAIGLVIGTILWYAHIYDITSGQRRGPDESESARRGISPAEFIYDLQRPKTPKGNPWITKLTIYPPVEVKGQDGKVSSKSYATMLKLDVTGNTTGKYNPYQLIADVPFKMAGSAPAPRADFTIRDYIDQLRKNHSEITYRYAWWNLPTAAAAIWGGGAVLLIGGIWPTLVSLMIGAGLGRKKDQESEYDLDRFKGGTEAAAKSASKAPTAEDHRKLRELQEKLEKNLAAGAAAADQPSNAAPAQAAAVRKLEGGPLELATASKEPEEAHEYKGEYYPVARPAGHKEESKP